MNMQEQEERDFEWGRESNEFQAAYRVSQLTKPADDTAKIEALRTNNRYVVITECDVFCPMTDACMGTHRLYVSDHATAHNAYLAACEFEDYQVLHPYVKFPSPTDKF